MMGVGSLTVDEIRPSSEHRMGRWELVAKEQSGSVDGKLLRRNIKGKKRFWLK